MKSPSWMRYGDVFDMVLRKKGAKWGVGVPEFVEIRDFVENFLETRQEPMRRALRAYLLEGASITEARALGRVGRTRFHRNLQELRARLQKAMED